MKDDLPTASANRANARRTMLLLVSLTSLVLVGLGLYSIVSEHYYGRTDKLGGAEVALWGTPAVLLGASTVCLGLAPLALWFRSRKVAVAWAALSVIGAAAAFAFAYRLVRG